jgi:aminoglycoside phosphotransferase (APT) family kinase protein
LKFTNLTDLSKILKQSGLEILETYGDFMKAPIWIHGDFAIGNILMDGGKLSAVIDFGGAAVGDPACDLVIAWTYLSGKAREIFISEMNMDPDILLCARAWALWKATFELCQIVDKNSPEALIQKRIIEDVIYG